MKRSMLAMMALLLGLSGGSATATEATGTSALLPPSIQNISTTLSDLRQDQELSEESRASLSALYEQTLEQLQAQQAFQRQLEQLDREIAQAPQALQKVQRELERTAPDNPLQLEALYAAESLEQLEPKELQLQDRRQTLQQHLDQLNSQVTTEQGRPERAQARIDQIVGQQADLSAQLAQLLDLTSLSALQQAERSLLQAQQQALQSERLLLRQQLRSGTARLDLLLAKRALAREQLENLNLRLQLLQSELLRQRRSETEQTLAQIDQQELDDPRIRALQETNSSLGQRLLELNDLQVELQEHSTRTASLQQRLSQLEQAVAAQNVALEDSPELGRLLLQQRKELPSLIPYEELDREIADLRLEQFQLYRQRQELVDIPQRVLELLAGSGAAPEQRALLVRILGQQLETQRDLLDRQQQLLTQNLGLAVDLKLNQKQLTQQLDQMRQQLQQQLFWLPTSLPVSLDWLQQLPSSLAAELSQLPRYLEHTPIRKRLAEQPLQALMVLLIILILLAQRQRIRERMNVLAVRVGNVRQETVWTTPEALGLQLLLVLPLILPLIYMGYLIGDSPHASARQLGYMLTISPLPLGLLLYAERLFLPQGIVVEHFMRHPVDYRDLRRVIRVAIATLLPMIISITLLGLEAVSSELLTLFGCSMLSLFLYQLKQQLGELFSQPLFNGLFWAILITAPLALVVLLFKGYALTALNLLAHLLFSIALIAVWALLRAVIHRSILVASRKLAYSRAASRLEAQREEKEIELPNLDLETVNRQTLRLTNSLLVVALALGLYWLWQDIWQLLARLDAITLSAGSEGVSLGGLMLAILIFAGTLILSRNLPGLLEMTLLSKLNLSNGISYATTSLLSYSIVAIGLVWGLSSLGVSWDKLQWLVAALGVGLGFGLQEIFANFMSGLILLFERPIRIGDTVTIGELSGSVSKIRIRATTITDWDNKEIVIPNKQFITERLINWTLSDPMTRVIIRVGVAYGSDLKLSHQLLLQAAREHPKVLDDPEPSAFFLNFGDSTLDHELRVYVREMTDRLPVTHEINQTVDHLFAEHGIEIAFPQRDLHLRSWPETAASEPAGKSPAGDEGTDKTKQTGQE